MGIKKKNPEELNFIAYALLLWHVPSCFSEELLFQMNGKPWGLWVSTQLENYRASFRIIKTGREEIVRSVCESGTR